MGFPHGLAQRRRAPSQCVVLLAVSHEGAREGEDVGGLVLDAARQRRLSCCRARRAHLVCFWQPRGRLLLGSPGAFAVWCDVRCLGSRVDGVLCATVALVGPRALAVRSSG